MNTTYRFLPLAALAVALTVIVSLQSCGKTEDKPQTADQKVENAMQGKDQAAPATEPAATGTATTELSDLAKKGQAIFYNSSFGKFKASCSMCHSDGSARTKDGKTRPGHTLAGVANRTSTWNGMYKGDGLKKDAFGARLCASGFLERGEGDMTKALSAEEADALDAYFAAIADAPGAIKTNLKIQWVTKPVFSEDASLDEKLTKPAVKSIMKLPGDPGAGQAVWQATCVQCHDLQKKKVGPAMAVAAKDMNYVAQSIRCGSMAMPFFAKDVLSDQQIADVIAFVQKSIQQ